VNCSLQTFETTSAGFYYEKPISREKPDYMDQTRSHIPNGDPDKAPRPISESRARFPDHNVVKPPLARGDWSKPLQRRYHLSSYTDIIIIIIIIIIVIIIIIIIFNLWPIATTHSNPLLID